MYLEDEISCLASILQHYLVFWSNKITPHIHVRSASKISHFVSTVMAIPSYFLSGVGAVAAGPAMAAPPPPLLAEDRKIKTVSKCQTRGEKRSKAVLRGPSHVLYNHVLVHVLAFDMYVGICDSASKEAYMYIISTCVGIRIGGDKLQCNHVHGVRVDDMRAQCRYTMSCTVYARIEAPLE